VKGGVRGQGETWESGKRENKKRLGGSGGVEREEDGGGGDWTGEGTGRGSRRRRMREGRKGRETVRQIRGR